MRKRPTVHDLLTDTENYRLDEIKQRTGKHKHVADFCVTEKATGRQFKWQTSWIYLNACLSYRKNESC